MASQMTIGKKLFLGVGASMALTLIVGGTAVWSIGSLGSSIDKIGNVNAKKRFLASEMNASVSAIIAAERGILVRSYMKDRAMVDQHNQDFRVGMASWKKNIDDFIPLLETGDNRRVLDEMQAGQDSINRAQEEFYRQAAAGQTDAAVVVEKDKILPELLASQRRALELVEQQAGAMQGVLQSAEGQITTNLWTTIIMVAFSVVVGILIVFTVRQINARLRKAISELAEGAGQVASAATQISSSSQSLAQGASQQAASLEETSASSEEINSMARKNAENSQSAAGLVTQSQQKFSETNHSLDKMVTAMSDINASSDKVSKIIKVIDEIAFQTNILALNAAVEAARAGEAGMGFAVVADEVRNLAQRCAQAANDTATLIEESIAKSNDGKTKVDQVATAIRAITEESDKVKTLVDEVSLGSQEQTRGIEQVSRALTQMEQVTQQSAANSEESAAAAEQLTAQASALMDVVAQLGGMVGGTEAVVRNNTARPSRRNPSNPGSLDRGSRSTAKSYSAKVPLAAMPSALPPPSKDQLPLDEEFKAMA